jgi:hypothetical protein
MEIRAYAHPYAHVDLRDVQALDEARLARVPVIHIYHMAADVDDQARTVERDCDTLQYATEVRATLIALLEELERRGELAAVLEALGWDPDQLAEAREIQRVERHNYAFGVRMLKEFEVQQSRLQWALIQKDPRRWQEAPLDEAPPDEEGH